MEKENKIVFGSTLAALQYAYENNTKIVLNNLHFPLPFEPSHIKHAWGLLYTKLMLDGQTIGGDGVKTSKITEDEIFVVCEGNIVNRLQYDLAIIFDDKKLIGLPDITRDRDKYKVVDYLQPVYLALKNLDSIYTEDNLVSEIHILKDSITSPIHIYSVSNLTKNNLTKFDYSDTMVKFKCEHIMTENGHSGVSTSNLTLKVAERLVIKQMDIYQSTEKVHFVYD